MPAGDRPIQHVDGQPRRADEAHAEVAKRRVLPGDRSAKRPDGFLPGQQRRLDSVACAGAKQQLLQLVGDERDVPWMLDRISIRRHSKELEDCGPGGTGSTFAALSSDVAVAHGKSVSIFCFDEYGQSTNSHLWDALDTGMGGRDQPLGICISTQAARDDAPAQPALS